MVYKIVIKTNMIILHCIIALEIKLFSLVLLSCSERRLNIKLLKARKHQIRTSLANVLPVADYWTHSLGITKLC